MKNVLKILLPALGLGLLAVGIFPQVFGLGGNLGYLESPGLSLPEAPELDGAGAFLNLDSLVEEEDESGDRAIAEPSERELVEGQETPSQQVVLEATGRVVDASGQPIPGAEVGVLVRQSWNLMRNRGRRRGRGGWRNSFRPSLLGKSTKTDAEGKFHLSGPTFEAGAATLAIRHKNFAPKLASKDWTSKNRKLEFGDILMDGGGITRGKVVSDRGVAISGAEVHYEPQSRRWDENGILKQLVLPVKSDANGFFEIPNLPKGNFQLEAKTDKHIPARSKRLKVKGQEMVDAGKITLEIGADLSGTVLDRKGAPVIGAIVNFSYAMGQDMRSFFLQRRGRAERTNMRQMMEKFRNRARFRKKVKTDKKGHFEATGLPKTGLRIRVSHKLFITEEKQNIQAIKSPRLDFNLYRKLVLKGRVVDVETGKPLSTFAINTRRIGNEDWKPQQSTPRWNARNAQRGNRRNPRRVTPRGNNLSPRNVKKARSSRKKAKKTRTPSAKELAKKAARKTQSQIRQANRTARISQTENRRAREQERLKQRFGPSGQIPGSTPDPSPHPKGIFTQEGLQPGTYIVYATAPGYAKISAGPVVLRKGSPPVTLNVSLRPGHTISGRVLDKISGNPISGARLDLFLPPLEEAAPPTNPLSQVFRPPSPGTRLDSTKTNGAGIYRFHAQLPGNFRIRVSAPDHAQAQIDFVRLPPGKDLNNLNVELSPGAMVTGKVLHLQKGARGNVIFASLKGHRKIVPFDPETGLFEARALPPGRYFVRLMAFGGRRGRGGMFRAIAEAVSGGKKANPDLVLRDGAKVRFNLDAAETSLGQIQGNILWNGKPGKGLHISLSKKKQSLAPSPNQSEMLGRLLRRITSSLQTRADAQGHFSIEDIPPGNYNLVVSPIRGRDSAAIARQEITVFAGPATPLNLNIVTGTLALNLIDKKTNKPVGGGRILLALSVETLDKAPKEWRKLPSFHQDRIRKGKIRIKNLPAGSYRYFIQGGGLKVQKGEVFVSAGPLATPTSIAVTRVKKKTKKTKSKKKGKKTTTKKGKK
jgi:protocatechuate 3,4-dioxygenase beta subunit